MSELLTPENVTRLWKNAAATETPEQRRLRRLDAVENARCARLLANTAAETVAAGRLADLIAKPDLAEAERAEFDRLNEGDRFDGLS